MTPDTDDRTAQAGERSNATDVGLVDRGTANGTVFSDANGDGVQQPGEAPLQGWTVFDDADGDGVHDAGEASAVSDAAGRYTILGLPETSGRCPASVPGWLHPPGTPTADSASRGCRPACR